MNILHHKSWHVRNKNNIQRVKRDEAKAAAEEKEKQRKVAVAESEARLNLLRDKSGTRRDDDTATSSTGKHVSLFDPSDIEKHVSEANEEAEAEKKLEKEKFEKKIGLLKYLVDDDLDLKNQPWYKSMNKRKSGDDSEIDLKRKKHDDPLELMRELTGENKKSKKHKKDKKHKDKDKEKSSAAPEVKKTKSIEELRAERLKRENEERIKAMNLLTGGSQSSKQPVVETDDRKRKYNNQFNPDFSRY